MGRFERKTLKSRDVWGHAPPPPHPKISPSKDPNLCNPEVIFTEINSTIFICTATDWNHLSDDQVKAPTIQITDRHPKNHQTPMHTPLLLHVN